MLKNEICLEIKKEDRTYRFTCSPDAPLGEIFDALSNMRGFVLDKLNEGAKAQKEAVNDQHKSES